MEAIKEPEIRAEAIQPVVIEVEVKEEVTAVDTQELMVSKEAVTLVEVKEVVISVADKREMDLNKEVVINIEVAVIIEVVVRVEAEEEVVHDL